MGFEKQLDLLDEFEKAGERPIEPSPLQELDEKINKMKAWAEKLPKPKEETSRPISPEEQAYWDKVFSKDRPRAEAKPQDKPQTPSKPRPIRQEDGDEIIDYKSRQYKD